ncbi:MAG: S8 family serine peptidase, partial [Acidobacteria bacterium]|nr:S8 family serine peptidase [Acidobacteriota bacterium]
MTSRFHVRHGAPLKAAGLRKRHWSKGWFALALFSMLAAAGSIAIEAAPGQGRGGPRRRAHVDRQLSERLTKGDGYDRERVIVTFKAGGKARKLQQLKALGITIDKDFGVIEAVTGNIPRGLLRELADQDDVVSLSVDATVNSSAITTAPGATFMVTSTANSGAGTLRQAILDANARAGFDAISFAIAGTGVHTITLTAALPAISSPVVINATTDDSFAVNANRPAVVVDGNGLLASGFVLGIGASGSTIRGLVIRQFAYDAVNIQAGSNNHLIAGNYLGRFTATGTDAGALEKNGGYGVYVGGYNNVIGGTAAADRNVISGNGKNGIICDGANAYGNVVAGNYIGTLATGLAALGNTEDGIQLQAGANNNEIGGLSAAARNVISGNLNAGIALDHTNTGFNLVRGNYIGLGADGTTVVANSHDGVHFEAAWSNTIGGTTPAARNVIAGNLLNGVGVSNGAYNKITGNVIGTDVNGAVAKANGGNGIGFSGIANNNSAGGTNTGDGNLIRFNTGDGVNVGATSWSNAVLGNAIADNGGQAIDLGTNGVQGNDLLDIDGGANYGQNFPVLTKVVTTGSLVEITGSLSSVIATTYRLEFFASPAADTTGYGEAATYLGTVTVTTNLSGVATFSPVLAAAVPAGSVVSATATRTSSSDTSELAANVVAAVAPYSLRNTLGLDAATNTTALTPANGAGITVAVIDSGLLQDGGGTTRIKTTRDFTTGNPAPPHINPVDGYGHGTHVAGVMGGDKAEVKGVAPNISFVSLRVLNNIGAGLTSNVINAIQWAIANKAAYGIDVINLSLGHPIFEPAATDPLVQAVEAAVRAGIVVVTSAGNIGVNPLTGQTGYAGITSPGNAPSAITVGARKTQDTARRSDDTIAEYSSRGPSWYDGYAKPDLVAPGHRVLGPAVTTQTLATLFPGNRQVRGGRTDLRLSGTSMAASVVSGTVALVLQQNRALFGATLTPNAVKAMLQATAIKVAPPGAVPEHVLAQGAGALNPAGAVQLAAVVNLGVPLGSWVITGPVSPVTTIDGQNLTWGQNIVWGENI